MKKLFFMVLLLSLILAGCNSEPAQPPFSQNAFLPDNVTDVEVHDVDFDGDSEPEKVLIYKTDNLTQHLSIIAYDNINEEWKLVIEEQFKDLINYYYLDLNQDGKQELVVQWADENTTGIGQYYVIAYYQGEYKVVTPPAIDPADYLDVTSGETEMRLAELEALDNGFRETYNIYCSDDYDQPCNVIQVDLDYEYAQLDRITPKGIKSSN